MKNFSIAILFCVLAASTAFAKGSNDVVNEKWQRTVLAAVDSFPQGGGYYIGRKATPDFPRTAWRGLNDAFKMNLVDLAPAFYPQKAQPSFCSLATYAVLIKALTVYDADSHKISREAWLNMFPFCGIVCDRNPNGLNQADGEGFWGRANANGPAIGVLVNELKAGFSFTAFRGAKSSKNKETPDERYMSDDEWRADPVWNMAQPGDFIKIFWNNNDNGSDNGAIIGVDDVAGDDQEIGHSVIFLGYDSNGHVRYWSSNGPGKNPKSMGYGIGTCDKTHIQRIVFTRITHPENFNSVKSMMPENVNKWLQSLAGKHHGTTAELKKYCGIK